MKLIKNLKTYAEIMLGATTIFIIFVTTREISTSANAVALLLLPAAYFIAFMWLGWIRPWETGIVLVLTGVFVAVFLRGLPYNFFNWTTVGTAILITGLLFLLGGWRTHGTI